MTTEGTLLCEFFHGQREDPVLKTEAGDIHMTGDTTPPPLKSAGSGPSLHNFMLSSAGTTRASTKASTQISTPSDQEVESASSADNGRESGSLSQLDECDLISSGLEKQEDVGRGIETWRMPQASMSALSGDAAEGWLLLVCNGCMMSFLYPVVADALGAEAVQNLIWWDIVGNAPVCQFALFLIAARYGNAYGNSAGAASSSQHKQGDYRSPSLKMFHEDHSKRIEQRDRDRRENGRSSSEGRSGSWSRRSGRTSSGERRALFGDLNSLPSSRSSSRETVLTMSRMDARWFPSNGKLHRNARNERSSSTETKDVKTYQNTGKVLNTKNGQKQALLNTSMNGHHASYGATPSSGNSELSPIGWSSRSRRQSRSASQGRRPSEGSEDTLDTESDCGEPGDYHNVRKWNREGGSSSFRSTHDRRREVYAGMPLEELLAASEGMRSSTMLRSRSARDSSSAVGGFIPRDGFLSWWSRMGGPQDVPTQYFDSINPRPSKRVPSVGVPSKRLWSQEQRTQPDVVLGFAQHARITPENVLYGWVGFQARQFGVFCCNAYQATLGRVVQAVSVSEVPTRMRSQCVEIVLLQPILLAIVLGVVFNACSIKMPPALDRGLELLASPFQVCLYFFAGTKADLFSMSVRDRLASREVLQLLGRALLVRLVVVGTIIGALFAGFERSRLRALAVLAVLSPPSSFPVLLVDLFRFPGVFSPLTVFLWSLEMLLCFGLQNFALFWIKASHQYPDEIVKKNPDKKMAAPSSSTYIENNELADHHGELQHGREEDTLMLSTGNHLTVDREVEMDIRPPTTSSEKSPPSLALVQQHETLLGGGNALEKLAGLASSPTGHAAATALMALGRRAFARPRLPAARRQKKLRRARTLKSEVDQSATTRQVSPAKPDTATRGSKIGPRKAALGSQGRTIDRHNEREQMNFPDRAENSNLLSDSVAQREATPTEINTRSHTIRTRNVGSEVSLLQQWSGGEVSTKLTVSEKRNEKPARDYSTMLAAIHAGSLDYRTVLR
ncbi:unnamed protein product [Amoebophrya sp. A25]|nr:unnamed protein product [Amoebophrya sp. A25]|eukprot:GSA25T00000052001.1